MDTTTTMSTAPASVLLESRWPARFSGWCRHWRPGACRRRTPGAPLGRLKGKQPKLSALWTPAYDADGQVRDGAWVTEITGLLDLSTWPKGMRVVVRKERPHPGRSCGSPTVTAYA